MHRFSRSISTLARAYGIQVKYRDHRGKLRTSPEVSIIAALRAMNVDVAGADDAARALRELRHQQAQRLIEPVVVAWDGAVPRIALHFIRGETADAVNCDLRLDPNADVDATFQLRIGNGTRNTNNGRNASYITVNGTLPAGYHMLRVVAGRRVADTLIVSAPRRMFSARHGEPRRDLGLFAPWHALRSETSWGCGDLRDLDELAHWASGCGCNLVGTLPMLATFVDEPFDPSPYAPVSRLFWNALLIDLQPVVRKYPQAAAVESHIQQRLEHVRNLPLVDYREVAKLRRQLLQAAADDAFKNEADRKALATFASHNPEARVYAQFRATTETRRQNWHDWPARLRNGDLRARDADESAVHYHIFVQWLLHNQLHYVANNLRKRDVDLYLDLPIGAHRDGFDVWRHQSRFAMQVDVGAPPDDFFARGQNWGCPPPLPQDMRNDHHRYFIASLRNHLQFARVLRLDHIMGLHRLYWVPNGVDSTDGVYVSYPADEHYAILSIESHRQQARIVGETLGTVPAIVNRDLKRHGGLGMYVSMFKLKPRHPPLPSPPRDSLACLNTHDTATFAGFWQARDIDNRVALGLLDAKSAARERRRRARLLTRAARFLAQRAKSDQPSSSTEAAMTGALAHLAKSPAEIVLVNIEDLWLEQHSQNVPGTFDHQHPNWRRKMSLSLTQIKTQREPAAILQWLSTLRRRRMRDRVSNPLSSPRRALAPSSHTS